MKAREHHHLETLIRVRVGGKHARSRRVNRARLEDAVEHKASIETDGDGSNRRDPLESNGDDEGDARATRVAGARGRAS
jgi:hypothetical protein